jgi:hypothetical protein
MHVNLVSVSSLSSPHESTSSQALHKKTRFDEWNRGTAMASVQVFLRMRGCRIATFLSSRRRE